MIALFVLLGGVYEAVRLVQLHLEESALQDEIERSRDLNRQLEETRRKLSDDPGEIEKRAREELGMIRRGETVFRVVKPQPQPERNGEDRRGAQP